MATTTNNASTANSQANTLAYAINQSLLNLNTTFPAKIFAINDDGTFDIQPLINILNASSVPSAPPNIYNVPAGIIQGGNAGLIITYQVSDTVLVSCSQRDISAIKKTWTQGNPASYRKFNLADAIIIMQLNNTLPTIYVKIDSAGITINSPSLPLTANCQTASINATDSATINSPAINLGASATNKLILEQIPFTIDIAGVQGGTGVTGVVATIQSGGSSVVKALP